MARRRRMIGLPAHRVVSLELGIALTCVGIAAAGAVLVAASDAIDEPVLAWTLRAVVFLGIVLAAGIVHLRIGRPLQVIANVLRGLRGGDYVTHTADAAAPGALGLVAGEVNALSRSFAEHRVRAVEAAELLDALMREIDVAVFAVDEGEVMRFANRAAERLLGVPEGQIVGRSAAEFGLGRFLRSEAPDVADAIFPGGAGRYAARRGRFRHGGRTRRFLVLHDVSRLARDEERQAWQRLVRVLSHELNNSLTPIQSIARSLDRMVGRADADVPRAVELREGLQIIAGRAQSLAGFVAAYSRLARRPPLQYALTDVGELVRRAAFVETRVPVIVVPGPDARAMIDPVQIEQLLINIVRNAADAALAAASSEPVEASWRLSAQHVEIAVQDTGEGLPADANLFVPYFTTKAEGTGLGLVVSREIAEAHGGSLQLVDRGDRRGCRATIRFPLEPAQLHDTPDLAALASVSVPRMARES